MWDWDENEMASKRRDLCMELDRALRTRMKAVLESKGDIDKMPLGPGKDKQ